MFEPHKKIICPQPAVFHRLQRPESADLLCRAAILLPPVSMEIQDFKGCMLCEICGKLAWQTVVKSSQWQRDSQGTLHDGPDMDVVQYMELPMLGKVVQPLQKALHAQSFISR